jgi:hypothetical protein
MSKHSIRQQVMLTVIVSDNDLVIIETGLAGSITINREECLCLADLLATATFELNRRRREGDGPVAPLTPFPVKEIELS